MSKVADSTGEYDTRIARWSARLAAIVLSPEQARGFACVGCGEGFRSAFVAGYGQPGGSSSHVFVCEPCDGRLVEELAAITARPGDRGSVVDSAEVANSATAAELTVRLAERGTDLAGLAAALSRPVEFVRARLAAEVDIEVRFVVAVAAVLGMDPCLILRAVQRRITAAHRPPSIGAEVWFVPAGLEDVARVGTVVEVVAPGGAVKLREQSGRISWAHPGGILEPVADDVTLAEGA